MDPDHRHAAYRVEGVRVRSASAVIAAWSAMMASDPVAAAVADIADVADVGATSQATAPWAARMRTRLRMADPWLDDGFR
jgi:hypothetical protein